MADLFAALDRPPSGRGSPVWFDSVEYCREKLLAGQPLPWSSPGELVAFVTKSQSIFSSDALLIDLGDFYAQHVERNPSLRSAIAARSRPGFALRTMLADDGGRGSAREAVSAIAASARSVPVVLSMPSPAVWPVAAAEQTGSPLSLAIGPDEADTAVRYVADLVRGFATAGVDGIILDEGSTPAAELISPTAYGAVINVASHYHWPVLVRTDTAACWPGGGHVDGVDAWIGHDAPATRLRRWGIVASGGDWLAGGELPRVSGGPLLVQVLASADPIVVVQRVRGLL